MQCPECRQDNSPSANFCTGCGTRLRFACASCSHQNPPGSRFCNHCGGSLSIAPAGRLGAPDAYTPKHLAGRILTSRAAVEGERKQVTILFADLKSSLELVVGRDPEEARHLLDAVLERMMAAVHEYEGTVNQVMGDGIMALFGAPLAHEDHALRACYAALRMLETIRTYGAEMRAAGRDEPVIRVGLNSGEVVVRAIGSDLYMDYSAVGNSTHLAARMEQLAEPGTALLTGHTLRLVEGRVRVRPVGDVVIKGMPEPVPVYELTGATGLRSRLEVAAARGLTRFVGRESEMAALLEARSRALSGRGQVVAVVGEAGVGKSRLIWELVHSGRLEHWLVLEGHAVPYGKGSAHSPIIELLRGYFRIAAADTAEATRERVAAVFGPDVSARFTPAVLALLGVAVDDPGWAALDADQQRRRMLDAIAHALGRSALAQPVCVVVEDLHWADAESLAVLDALVDTVAGARILLVASYRPDHRHEWTDKGHYTELPVETFGGPAMDALLDELLGPAPELIPLRRMIADRTGGNPFFTEETVRYLVDTGALAGQRGQRRLLRTPEIAHVPETVHSVIAARIDRLSQEDKRVLQTASAIGRDVSRSLLERVAEVPAEQLADALARLEAGQFVYESRLFPEVEYAFRHALTHEVAYGSLVRERRRALDGRIVEAIEARARAGGCAMITRLAHHAVRGELWDKALEYCREAGREALSRFGHRAAAAHFEQALVALANLGPDRAGSALAIDIRLELRYALLPLGRYRRMLELLTDARQHAEALGDRARLGLVSCLLCNYCTLRFEFSEAVQHGALALEIAEALGDRGLALATNAMLALAHYGAGEYRRAVDAGTRAATEACDAGRERFGIVYPPAVYGGTVASWALAELGDFGRARESAAHALAIAEALDHPQSVIFACLGMGVVLGRQGAAKEAIAVLERALGIWETADLPAVLVELAGPLASAYVLADRADDAIALLERAVAQALALRHRLGNVLRSGGVAEAYLAMGRVEEAMPLAELFVELARLVNGRGHLAWALRLLGDVAARRDPPDVDTAERALGECLALAGELGMQPLEARAMLTRGALLARVGRRDEAHAVIACAAERFAALDMPMWTAACHAG